MSTAFFVFWIYLGSIINFHQHHLFGRNLMQQGVLCKREETVHASNHLPVTISTLSVTAEVHENEFLAPVFSGVMQVVSSPEPVFLELASPEQRGLRAPPVSVC